MATRWPVWTASSIGSPCCLWSSRPAQGQPGSGQTQAYPALLIFRIVLLQSLCNLSDEGARKPPVPGSGGSPFCRRAGRMSGLAGRRHHPALQGSAEPGTACAGALRTFDRQLESRNFRASKGRIVDAGIVPVPKALGSRREHEQIRAGNPPGEWSEAQRRQKDVDARWTKQRGSGILAARHILW